MNKLKGKITAITIKDQLSKISVDVENHIFQAIVINENTINANFVIGQSIYLLFKETDVTLSIKVPEQISIDNQIPVIVTGIKKGTLLSRISVSFQKMIIKTVVPTEFATPIEVGMSLTLLIRSNELLLME